MNRLLFSAFALAAFACSAATDTAKRPKLTPAERHARMLVRTGGVIDRPISGKTFKLVNAAGLSTNVLSQIAESLHSGLFFPIVVVDKAMTPKEALDDKTGFALLFVRTGGPRLLLAPEDGWAQIDVTTLESSDAKVFGDRLMKEAWRASVYALGGGNTHQPMCVMKPVASVADLDATSALVACPEVFANVVDMARKFGVKSLRPSSYIRACMEGWAPAPTNDIQKAIWDKVHQTPAEPLKIKPETKKVAE